MRTKILLLVGLLSLGISGFAQSDIRFGITANPSLVWVKPDNTQISGDGVRFGFNFGLVVDYVFGNDERYSINSGLGLLLAGAKVTSTDPDSLDKYELTAKINYLELPVSIKLRSNEVGYLTFYGQLGLTPQFMVRSRANITVKDESGAVTEDINNLKFRDIEFYPNDIEKVRPFNVGLLVEAGLEYDLTESTVLVGGLYFNTGFIDMFKDNDSERVVSRNMGLRLSVLF
jgi:opacity protein-like surface antigen